MLLFVLVFSLFCVNAAVLDIRTFPNHDIWITAKDPVNPEKSILQPMKFSSDENGSLLITYDIDESFTLVTSVKDGPESVLFTKGTEVYTKDQYVKLDLFPEGYVPPVRAEAVKLEQVPLDNSSNVTLNETVENTTIEGNKILPIMDFSILSPYLKYIYAAVLFILIIVLFFVFRKRPVNKRIKCVDKKITCYEKKIEKMKLKKKKLLLKAKEEMINKEEALIRFRGGSVPEKGDGKSMVERLRDSLKK